MVVRQLDCVTHEEGWGDLNLFSWGNTIALLLDPKGGYREDEARLFSEWKDRRQLPQVTARGNLTEHEEKILHSNKGLALEP